MATDDTQKDTMNSYDKFLRELKQTTKDMASSKMAADVVREAKKALDNYHNSRESPNKRFLDLLDGEVEKRVRYRDAAVERGDTIKALNEEAVAEALRMISLQVQEWLPES